MSRAFVKEPDGEQLPEDRPRPAQSSQPNYITRHGLTLLRQRHDAEKDKVLRAHLAERLKKAIVLDPPRLGDQEGREEVRFGARVRVAGQDGREREFTIVGEDEAEPGEARISWLAPLASAVLGARVGDIVTWERPDGAVELEVLEIRYKQDSA